MSYKDILKMIEEVDPSDSAKLDEIDDAVMRFLFPDHTIFRDKANFQVVNGIRRYPAVGFVRSRDALKAIRPTPYNRKVGGYQDAWYFQILPNGDGEWRCVFGNQGANPNGKTPYFHTEELAELHAIIQAIAYERQAGEA